MTRTLCPPLCMWWLQAGFADAGEASMWKTWKKTKLLYYTKYTEFNLNFRHSLRKIRLPNDGGRKVWKCIIAHRKSAC